MESIEPFHLQIPQAALDDLTRRLNATRWPERETVPDWSQGAPLDAVQALCAHWRHGYDWRRCEAMLNGLGQHRTMLDGLGIHFLHVRSPEPDALPMVMTHGWPGSVVEFARVVGPLTDPVAHGGEAADAFHLVMPSLPGFGFSDRPAATGWNLDRIARNWAVLMQRLGYGRWVAQGGDWGAFVSTTIGIQAPPGCAGVHVNMLVVSPPPRAAQDPDPLVQRALACARRYAGDESGYARQQATRPQTLGYGLTDSPAGQAAWIYEKLRAWSDPARTPEQAFGLDAMLDNIMLYWLPGTAAASARLYWESLGQVSLAAPIMVPVGVSQFRHDLAYTPRRWAEALLPRLVHWGEVEAGGHFAAFERPDLFVPEVRAAFRAVR